MNIHFQQAEKKSLVFFYMMVVVVAFTVSMLIWSASRTVNLHLSIPSSSSGQPANAEISKLPVAIPAPLPPAEWVHMTAAPVPSSTPSPLPQAVPAPVPDLP